MSRLVRICVVWLVAFAAGATPNAAPNVTVNAAPRSLTLTEYRDALAAVAAAIDDPTRDPMLPDEWQITISNTEYSVSTTTIRRDLTTWRRAHDDAARSRLVARLELLRSDAQALELPRIETSSERSKLKAILATREFERVSRPTAMDRVKQAIADFVNRIFDVLGGSSAFPTLSRVVVFGLIALAVGMAAWTLFRYTRDLDAIETVLPGQIAPAPREWRAWLTDAQSAAATSDWRTAMHAAYWCAVAFLESRGAWRPDRTRTPREYFRLLPPASDNRRTLVELTRCSSACGTEPRPLTRRCLPMPSRG